MSKVTHERLRDEFIIILNEAKPLYAIKRMENLKILKLVHPNIIIDQKVMEVIEEITTILIEYSKSLKDYKIERWIIYFLAIIIRLKQEDVLEIASRYKITAEQLKKIDFDRTLIFQIIRNLSYETLRPSQIYRELEILSLEGIIYLLARSRNQELKKRINEYLFKYRNTKFLVRGKDLIGWGYPDGPFYKKALLFLEDAQLDGLFKNMEEAKKLLENKFKNTKSKGN